MNVLIENVVISCDCYSYSQLLSGMKLKVYFEIIFPLTLATEKDNEEFIKQPTEYQSHLVDTCEE